eukprot:TRINITY_DN9525_c0_g1_i1.p1 TRINITY_DN9525_c0_g1~~TRINITY_DN9525_c0_g1_i1.p1  ORF type:complete len:325 (+),score=35.47 TRINITY_DN9525_c0_g1_i1:55-975(+)
MALDFELSKLILQILYGALALVALVQMVRIFYATRIKLDKPISFRVTVQIFLFASVICRLVLMVIPFTFYNLYIRPIIWLQIILDLLPEVLFWATNVVLIFLWANMYHFSRNVKKQEIDITLNRYLGFVMFTVVIIVILIALICDANHVYNLVVEAVFLVILAAIAMLAFGIYGFLLHRRLSHVPVHPPHRKYKMLRRIRRIVILVILCNVAHATFLLITDEDLQYKRSANRAWVWFTYFVSTEAFPAGLVLFLFRKVPRDRTGRNSYVPITDQQPAPPAPFFMTRTPFMSSSSTTDGGSQQYGNV